MDQVLKPQTRKGTGLRYPFKLLPALGRTFRGRASEGVFHLLFSQQLFPVEDDLDLQILGGFG